MKLDWLLVFSLSCFAFAGIVHLTGCDPAQVKANEMDYDVKELSRELHYYKDTNSNLCFAVMNLDMQSATMTNVPCTPEVEKMAHDFTSEK